MVRYVNRNDPVGILPVMDAENIWQGRINLLRSS